MALTLFFDLFQPGLRASSSSSPFQTLRLGYSLVVWWNELPLKGAQVQSLVRELRSHVLPVCVCVCVCVCVSCPVVSNSLQPRGLYVAHQATLSIEFSRQEHWNGLPFPSPRGLPDSGMEARSDSLPSEPSDEYTPCGAQHPPKNNNSSNKTLHLFLPPGVHS